MRSKIQPLKPVLILLYGFPGSGKTYFARQFTDSIQMVHLEQDRIRYELFQKPTYSKAENAALGRITEYMVSEFLNNGISVVLDMNAMRLSQRHNYRELARNNKAQVITVWFQIDADTSFVRNQKRDRRKADDRFAVGYTVDAFKQIAAYMQHPEPTEDFVVTSGKHSFSGQLSAVVRKLSDIGVIKLSAASHQLIKPELINLVPTPQVHTPNTPSRRNIVLR